MSVTGLFLVLFLVVHLLGNLQLLLPAPAARSWFNAYSEALAVHPLIKVAAWITSGSIALHVAVAGLLTRRNRAARPYDRERPGASSPWYGRWMGWLGVALLVFLVLHLWDFWYPFHYGPIDLDAAGNRDLYAVVARSFANPVIVLGYMVSMAALGFHLWHGLRAAFISLGLYGVRAERGRGRAARLIAWGLAGSFAAIPLYVFLAGAR